MYGLYDHEGILRFVNADKHACLAYAELFGLNSKNYSLMMLNESTDEFLDFNLAQSQVKNNN